MNSDKIEINETKTKKVDLDNHNKSWLILKISKTDSYCAFSKLQTFLEKEEKPLNSIYETSVLCYKT